jgi:CHAD domain-containing protein
MREPQRRLIVKGKRVHGLDCASPADEMIRLALSTQIKAMCALRERALDPDDVEGVHDMRVLSRRLRSAISDFEPYLRKPRVSMVKLRAIARSLGAVRDEDVALAALKNLKASVTGEALDGVDLLEQERRSRRDIAFTELEKAIKPSAIAAVLEEFHDRMRTLATIRPAKSTPNEERSGLIFGPLAAEVINQRLKEFRSAAGETIYRPTAIADLHELRIRAKRLRYAIELSMPCWGKRIKEVAKEVALMQTSLGELHDCDVWIEELGSRLKRAARRSRDDLVNVRERAAAVWLLRHFTFKRTEHYGDALARWEEWESIDFLGALNALVFSPKS